MPPAVMYYSFNMNCQQNKVAHFHFSLLEGETNNISLTVCV